MVAFKCLQLRDMGCGFVCVCVVQVTVFVGQCMQGMSTLFVCLCRVYDGVFVCGYVSVSV